MSRKDNEELAYFDNSEVMRNFMKIAYESGLARKDDVEVGNGEEGRYSSESKKDIEANFQLQKDIGPDEDGRDLIDMAHPKDEDRNVVDSYLKDGDKVETLFEAHDVGVNIATKGPSFNTLSHRNITAIHDLVNELVVIADEMDIREQNDLSKFADEIVTGINNTGNVVKKKVIFSSTEYELIKTAQLGSIVGKMGGLWKYLPLAFGIGLGGYLVSREMHSGNVTDVSAAYQTFKNKANEYAQSKEGIEASSTDIQQLGMLFTQLDSAVMNFVNKSREFNAVYTKIINEMKDTDETEQELKTALSNLEPAYQNFMKSKSAIDAAFGQQSISKERLNEMLAEMSRIHPADESSDNTTWENIKGHLSNLVRAVSKEEGETKSALASFNAAVEYEVDRKKNAYEFLKKIIDARVKGLQNKPQQPSTPATEPGTINA